jgi:3-phosphoshikimate 1-carboxyvinyltransferase
MSLKFVPPRKFSGQIDLPASKSYSIRAFFVAACGGYSRIIGPSDCHDALAAMRVARTLGAEVSSVPGGVAVRVPAFAKKRRQLKVRVGESGTSLRFVLPLLPFYCGQAEVTGRGTLNGRPNRHLCETLRRCGLAIRGAGKSEAVPIRYSSGEFSAGRVVIDGSVSSQFVSALMIALPRAGRDTLLVMKGKLVSQDYVLMTRQIMERAGIRIRSVSSRVFLIPGQARFKGLRDFHVPSDYGLAAFHMAAAALVPSDITLKGHFDDRLVQSDGAIFGFLERMGVRFTRTRNAIRIKGPFSLTGGVFSLKDCPDLVPVMAVLAMFARGRTRLKDIAHARVKESDRISDLRAELLKTGARIEERPNELIIDPSPQNYREGAVLDPRHDHRLAMAFAVLGLRVGLTVRDMACTAKSYPGFVRDFTTSQLKA